MTPPASGIEGEAPERSSRDVTQTRPLGSDGGVEKDERSSSDVTRTRPLRGDVLEKNEEAYMASSGMSPWPSLPHTSMVVDSS